MSGPESATSASGSRTRSTGRGLPGALLLLVATVIPAFCFVSCSRGSDTTQAPVAAAPKYRISEHSESGDSILWRVEMAKDATKTEMESVARTLLASAPVDRTRLVEFYLGPLGPFNPTYASIRVEPGHNGAGQGLFYHMH